MPGTENKTTAGDIALGIFGGAFLTSLGAGILTAVFGVTTPPEYYFDQRTGHCFVEFNGVAEVIEATREVKALAKEAGHVFELEH